MSGTERSRSGSVSRGFTLTEMLVVIGILVVLVSATIAAVSMAQRKAMIVRCKADLQAVGHALDSYAADFKGIYPMSRDPATGKANGYRILARALIAPGPADKDGLDGPGFRVIAGGKPCKPYLAPDKFRTTLVDRVSDQWDLLDVFGSPIEYYPRRVGAQYQPRWSREGPSRPPMAYLAGPPHSFNLPDDAPWLYDVGDKDRVGDGVVPPWTLVVALGDGSGAQAPNNVIDLDETLRHTGPFVLASPGPDRKFTEIVAGDDQATLRRKMTASDDGYNFDQ